jgi:hypothetical protein
MKTLKIIFLVQLATFGLGLLTSCTKSTQQEKITANAQQNTYLIQLLELNESLMSKCMKTSGFKTKPVPALEAPARYYFRKASESERLQFRENFGYGMWTASAELFKFYETNSVPLSLQSGEAPDSQGPNRDAYLDAQTECGKKVSANPAYVSLQNTLKGASDEVRRLDSEQTLAMQAWSKCTSKELRFSVASRTAFFDRFLKEGRENRVTPQIERAMASAEYRCSISVGIDPYEG